MTAAPEVKKLDAIITKLGIEQVLVVGRNEQPLPCRVSRSGR